MPTIRIAALVMVLFSACATILETVHVPADNRGWKLGHGSNRPGTTLKEFIPANEEMGNWSRMLTIQFLEEERRSPNALMEGLRSQMQQRCPNSNWNVVTQDGASVTYEWSISACPGQSDQHELGRLLKGNDGVHRVAYVRKVPRLDATERDIWLKALEQSYVVKDGVRVAVAP